MRMTHGRMSVRTPEAAGPERENDVASMSLARTRNGAPRRDLIEDRVHRVACLPGTALSQSEIPLGRGQPARQLALKT